MEMSLIASVINAAVVVLVEQGSSFYRTAEDTILEPLTVAPFGEKLRVLSISLPMYCAENRVESPLPVIFVKHTHNHYMALAPLTTLTDYDYIKVRRYIASAIISRELQWVV